MTYTEIIILALALSLDALIVSFSYGLVINSKRIKNSIMLASAFGFFQFLMPITGWYLSSFVYNILSAFSKWIVFSIFMFLAFKFIKSAFSDKEEVTLSCISLSCIFLLAVATSIDALGAGISLRFVNVAILIPSIIVGIITGINSFLGFWIGSVLKRFPSKAIEITGAILLCYLAFKSVI